MANFQRQGNPMPAGGPWQHAQFSEVPAPPALQAQLPTLDWRGYFTRFQAVHGEPINHKGRLLYRDGWGHDALHYEGPEFAPPADPDERRQLIQCYWQRRRQIISNERDLLALTLRELKNAQTMLSIPLQEELRYVGLVEDAEGKPVEKMMTKSQDLDFERLDSRLEELNEMLSECNAALKKVQEPKK